ncbi:MAG: citrate lyase subunit beta [Bacteroidales bacterium]|nr:citrate lyase subunit beta [Bacteroidales bacterium]
MDFDHKTATAGNKGEGVRSDCYVSLELKDKGGLNIIVNSKVNALYGRDIRQLAQSVLTYFHIQHAELTIDDTGALPLIMMARIEAAVKKLIKTELEYLPDIPDFNLYQTPKDRFRFSRLYLPGNTPRLMINAGIHKPDGIILDLEDAVAPEKKYEASFVVRNALRSINFYGAERMVRINQIPAGSADLEHIVGHNVNLILVPKVEDAGQIHDVNERINALLQKKNINDNIWLMPIIESARGVMKSFEIAAAAGNVVALAIGLEDYTADIGAMRTQEGTESFFARSMVVNAAKAARIQAIDSVYSDISNMEGLKQNVLASKLLGFDGMGCIHPRQIRVIHDYFAPEEAEIEKARKIVNAFIEATEKGLGVVALGSKMIDPPVVKRAQKTIDLAIKTGKLDSRWREEMTAKI